MLWFPCTIIASGNGPGPSGYQTRAFSGSSPASNPQYFLRVQRIHPVESLMNADASTVRVLILTEAPYSGRRMSVPTP